MSKIRLVVGRSGSGKTDYCINEFVQTLCRNRKKDGRTDAYLIVPEQFAVAYERKVLNHEACTGLLGSEVISFNRLAHRIVSETGVLEHESISPSGRAMLLVSVIRELDAEGRLTYYKKCAENAKSIAGLLETMTELSKYCVSYEIIQKAAERSRGNDAVFAKLSELALIYKAFEEKIVSDYTDSTFIIRQAAELVKSGRSEAGNAVIWIDGFSGFTEAELILLNAFAERCPELNICLFYDDSNDLIFSCPNETVKLLRRRFVSLGHIVEIVKAEELPENRDRMYGKRYKASNSLGIFEKMYAAGRRGPFEKFSVENGAVRIFSCTDSYQEAENCSRIILELVKEGYRFEDIAVVSSGLEDKASVFRTVFSRAGIPFFLDIKRELSGHPVIRCILSLFDIIVNDMCSASVFAMLKTGLYKTSCYSTESIDLLENTALMYGVKNSRTWKRMCESLNNKFIDHGRYDIPEYVLLANDIYELFHGDGGLVRAAAKCRNTGDCCKFVFKFASAIGIEDSVEEIAGLLSSGGMQDVSDTYLRIWNVLSEVLKEAECVVGDITVHGYKKLWEFFADVLKAAVATYKVGFIPFTMQCVQIGNSERSRYLDKKVVFVIGANEGEFPKKFTESGVLGDAERDILKSCGASLAYSSIERTFFAQFNIYSVLVSPSEKLYISYAVSDRSKPGSSELFPAPCISTLRRIFDNIETESVSRELKDGDFAEFTDENSFVTVSSELTAELLKIGSECKMSVSRLENYRRCPYNFFLQQCLKLKERDIGIVKNTNIGTYFHGLVENCTRNDGFKPGYIDRETLKHMVNDAASEFLQQPENCELKYLFENSYKNTFLKDRIDSFAVGDIGNIASLASKTGFNPSEYELGFGMPGDEGLPALRISCDETELLLRGKIDSINVRESEDKKELCVVDYKSSVQDFGVKEVESGIKLQLLTYLYAVSENKDYFQGDSEKEIVPSAVLYYVFGKDARNYTSEKELLRHTYSGFVEKNVFSDENKKVLPGVNEADLLNLVDIVKDNIKTEFGKIASGKFCISPEETVNPCRYCIADSVCRKPKKS